MPEQKASSGEKKPAHPEAPCGPTVKMRDCVVQTFLSAGRQECLHHGEILCQVFASCGYSLRRKVAHGKMARHACDLARPASRCPGHGRVGGVRRSLRSAG